MAKTSVRKRPRPAVAASSGLVARIERAGAEELKRIGEALRPKPELIQLLGHLYWLATHSRPHAGYTLAEFQRRFIPSIRLNQFRIYFRRGVPIAFANWAWLSDEAHKRYRTARYELRPQDWNSGRNLWFPELIAPFGDAKRIALNVRSLEMFRGQRVHAHP